MIILDTNVLSELMRPEPEAVVLHWMIAQTDALYVTALSYAEILLGIDLLPQGQRRQRLGEQASAMFTEDFAEASSASMVPPRQPMPHSLVRDSGPGSA